MDIPFFHFAQGVKLTETPFSKDRNFDQHSDVFKDAVAVQTVAFDRARLAVHFASSKSGDLGMRIKIQPHHQDTLTSTKFC